MRILHIDKFLDAADPASGGLGAYMPVVTRLLRAAGHTVLHFGCVAAERAQARHDPAPPAWAEHLAEMPPFIDYAALTGRWRRIRGGFRIIHDHVAASRLDAFLSRHPADVAHVHRIYHHLTPSVLPVLRRRGIPVVMSVRDYRLLCPAKLFLRDGRTCRRCQPHRYWNCLLGNCGGDRPASAAVALETFLQRFFRRYVQNVDFFLCPSQFMADAMREDAVPANKIRWIPHPVAAPASPAEAAQRDDVILYVGRLSAEKGLDLMLDVAEALPDARVNIVGDGPMRQWLADQAGSRGLKNVTMTGHVPNEQLGRHYCQAAVVVVPSRCFENSPYAMLEAMLAGRCVVAPAHGPIGEWIRDGQTGRLFRPGDREDLVRVVGEALSDRAGRDRIARAGRQLVRDRHDPDRAVGRLIDVYEEALGRCESP